MNDWDLGLDKFLADARIKDRRNPRIYYFEPEDNEEVCEWDIHKYLNPFGYMRLYLMADENGERTLWIPEGYND